MSAEHVSRNESAARPSQGFDRLLDLVAADMQLTNQLIIDRMQSRVALIPQLAGYLIAAGGKRLRPLLTLASARLCGYEGDRHCGLAACVEFIHTATLLHDDVVDESDLRRGQESANALFGNQASVLVGDFLFSRAFELMVADGSLDVLRILSNASKTIAEGEVLQLSVASNTETTEAAYMEVIAGKTAALFAAACEVGAVVNSRPANEQAALREFGQKLGMAFQLVDDVLDYSAQQAKLGKEVGNDFREGKMTLPVILAFERGSEEEKTFWRRTLEQQEIGAADLDQAIAYLQRTGSLAATIDRARQFGREAVAALQIFPDSPYRQAMVEAVSFAIERDY